MILDAQTLMSDSQALTATAYSSNTYDSGAAGNDISIGEAMCVALNVEVAADFTTTDETYEFQVVQSANANLSSHDVLCSRSILAADLTAGSHHILPLPSGSKTKRYLGVRYVLAGTTPTVTVSASYIPQSFAQVYKNYPDGITIS